MKQFSISSTEVGQVLVATVAAWLVYHLVQSLYNISPLHPLSSIPGPKLAAATYLSEFWFDVILLGKYTSEIGKMHEKYGPIVRINPNEVHCSDPKFIDEIYAVGGRKRNKPLHQVRASAVELSEFGTIDHDLHRKRRSPVARFFSRAMISQLEADIAPLSQKLCDKLLVNRGQEEPLELGIAYSNLTTDIVWAYCFGESFGLLEHTGFDLNFRDPTRSALTHQFTFRFFPFLKGLKSISTWFIDYLPKNTALLVKTMEIDLPKSIQKNKDDRAAGIVFSHPTIIGAILDSELSAKEKSNDRIVHEAFALTGAGTETTSWALTVMTYFLLQNPDMLSRLTEELTKAVDDPRNLPPWTQLEKLPYLDAVIQEGLRLSYGVSQRSARVPTEEDLVYEGEWNKKPIRYTIPRGYAIGMSSALMNHDETIFRDSYEFQPDRWLDPKQRKELDHASLGFGKGSRSCLGMNLALCEMYLTMTALVLRVLPYMRLYETTDMDVRYDYDMMIPRTKVESKGVRVILV